MTWPRSTRNVSAGGITPLLALLMICVLTMSHGTAGVASPYAGNALHSHDRGFDHHATADSVDAYDADDSLVGDNDDSRAIDQDIAHVHPAADMVPSLGEVPGQHFARASHVRPPPAGSLRSTEPAPLLEPPSA